MKKILFIILILMCSYGVTRAQNTDPLPPPYPQIQSFYGMIYEKTLQAIRVKLVGSVTFTTDSTKSRYKVQANILNFPDSTKSRYKTSTNILNFPSNPTTSIKQDTLLALLKYLGRTNLLPYFMSGSPLPAPTPDSLVGQTAKVIDFRYSNGTYPWKVNMTFTNKTVTTDTIRIKTWCVAKNDSSYFNVGWKDRSSGASGVGTPGVNESDMSLVIIPANTSRTFESDGYGKAGLVRIMWKTNAGKAATKLYLSWQRVN